jgi:OOP family OmpA-OmpF porin
LAQSRNRAERTVTSVAVHSRSATLDPTVQEVQVTERLCQSGRWEPSNKNSVQLRRKVVRLRQSLILFALTVPAMASAGQSDHWYVTPEIGGISPNYQRSLEKNDWLYGLAFGREINRYFNLELNLDGTRLSGRNGADSLNIYGTTLDALAVLNRSGTISPYLRLGAGFVHDVPGQQVPNQTNFAADAGVGFYWNLWRSAGGTRAFALRPEIKVRWENPGHSPNLQDYIADLGFQYSFGGSPAPSAPAEVAPPPPPPPPPAPKPTRATPPAPPPAEAPTPSVQHSAFTLPTRGSVILKGVNFAFNSAHLTASSRSVLDQAAAGLKHHPLLKVEIQGYTDSIGTRAYNLKLSQQRAESVRDFLVTDGVAPGQLRARGYGPADPIASNRTAAGRALNRRVVMKVLSNPNAVKVKGQGTAK